MDAHAVLKSFDVLMRESDLPTAEAFLLASVYATAIAKDETPRDIADSLFKSLPHDTAWPEQRRALLATLDPD